jgi:hypothetical protein
LGNISASSKGNTAKEAISNGGKPYVEKLSFAEKISPYLISKYGEPNLLFFFIVAFGVGIALFLIGSELQSRIIFFSGIPFLLLAVLLYNARTYYLSRICKKCGREFAYVQTRKSEICQDGMEKTTYNYYRCKFCGHEHVEVKTASIISPSEQI